MSPSRPIIRRLAAAIVAIGLVAGLMAVPISAATTAVTGSLTSVQPVTLSPAAVAIVTIVDQTAAPDCRGHRRRGADRWTDRPADRFLRPGRRDRIDPTHAYALFATVTDGANVWQNSHGEPSSRAVPSAASTSSFPAVPASAPASVTGIHRASGRRRVRARGGRDRGAHQGRDRHARHRARSGRSPDRRTSPSPSASTQR